MSETSDSSSKRKEEKPKEEKTKEEKQEKKDKKKSSDSSDDELNKPAPKPADKKIKEEDSKSTKKDKKKDKKDKKKDKKKSSDSSDVEANKSPKPDKNIKDEESKSSKKDKKDKKKDKKDKDKKKKKNEEDEDTEHKKQRPQSVEITDPVLLEKQKRANEFFSQKKHRRLSSPSKAFIGDHLGVLKIPDIVETLNQFNPPEKLLFSDHCTRLTSRNHMEDCSLLVTTNYMFILNNRLQHLLTNNPISIENIIKIETSLETDNTVVFFLPGYDSELIMSSYKIELMQIIADRYKEINGRDLEIRFSNIIEFEINEDTIFEFDFVRANDGIRMTLFVKAKPKITWSKRPN